MSFEARDNLFADVYNVLKSLFADILFVTIIFAVLHILDEPVVDLIRFAPVGHIFLDLTNTLRFNVFANYSRLRFSDFVLIFWLKVLPFLRQSFSPDTYVIP